MMCLQCGRTNAETSETCQACGSSLKAAQPATAEQPATTVASTPVVEAASTVLPSPAASISMKAAETPAPVAAPMQPTQPAAAARPVAYAGFWRRFAAYLIDGIVLSAPVVAYWNVVLMPKIESILGPSLELTPFGSDGLPTPELMALAQAELLLFGFTILVSWLYFSILESSKYQASLGKLAMGIKVTDTAGKRISFARATGRSLGKLLSGIFFVGYVMAAFTEKKQAMHDLIAATIVVVKEK